MSELWYDTFKSNLIACTWTRKEVHSINMYAIVLRLPCHAAFYNVYTNISARVALI